MELATISKPYANAIFAVAQQDKTHKKWRNTLQALCQLILDDNMQNFLAAKSIPQQKKLETLQSLAGLILGRGLTNQENAFLDILLRNNRSNALTDILALFEHKLNALEGTKSFAITSAYPLNKAQQQHLVDALANTHKATVSIHTKTDKTLLAGVVIKEGDKVTNASIEAKVEALRSRLLDNINDIHYI